MMDILKGKPKSSGLHYAAFSSDNVCQRNLHLVGKAPWRCCSQLGGTSAHLQAWAWAGGTSQCKLGRGQGWQEAAQVQFLQIDLWRKGGVRLIFPMDVVVPFLKSPLERDGHFLAIGSVCIFL